MWAIETAPEVEGCNNGWPSRFLAGLLCNLDSPMLHCDGAADVFGFMPSFQFITLPLASRRFTSSFTHARPKSSRRSLPFVRALQSGQFFPLVAGCLVAAHRRCRNNSAASMMSPACVDVLSLPAQIFYGCRPSEPDILPSQESAWKRYRRHMPGISISGLPR